MLVVRKYVVGSTIFVAWCTHERLSPENTWGMTVNEDRIPVRQVRFGGYESDVEGILREYHAGVADGFHEQLTERIVGRGEETEPNATEFDPSAYVESELEKDVAYLTAHEEPNPLVGALDGDTVVGCVYVYRLSEDTGEIKRLYVRDKYRGLGLGRTLMETLIDVAREQEYETLRLDTAPFMQSAMSLYRDIGFETYDGTESISDIPEQILNEITYMRMDLKDTQ